VRRDDEPLAGPGVCGRSVGILGTGFACLLLGDHDEHVWRGEAQASRGLGYNDNLGAELEVRWRDDRPAATVGDVRRALARRSAT
jgi:hypothetical protein